MVGVHHIGTLKSERRKPQARSTETDFFFFSIKRSFRGLSTYTVIINNQLQRKQKQYSNECAIFLHGRERKKFQQQIPSNIYSTFFCDTSFPFSPLCLRWTLVFNTKKTTYSVSFPGNVGIFKERCYGESQLNSQYKKKFKENQVT